MAARIRRSLFCLIVFMLTVGYVAPAAAGDAEMAGGRVGRHWSDWIGVPDAELCTTESVAAEAFVHSLATATAHEPETIVSSQIESIDELPDGEPVTIEDAAEALDTVRELIACLNGGKIGSILALFSDNALAQLMWGSGFVPTAMTETDMTDMIGRLGPALKTPPTPLAGDQLASLEEILEVRKLDDGRILVISVGKSSLASGLAFAILEEIGDRWLISAFGSIGLPSTPTP